MYVLFQTHNLNTKVRQVVTRVSNSCVLVTVFLSISKPATNRLILEV